MIKVGRYKITFAWPHFWIQTRVPTTVWEFLFLRIFKEARTTDDDKHQQFPLGTEMIQDGRRYRYYKAGEAIAVGTMVKEKNLGEKPNEPEDGGKKDK